MRREDLTLNHAKVSRVKSFVFPYRRSRVRYFGNKSSGQAVDRGLYAILFGIALGILTEISVRGR
jgi:hypothetical protein